MNKESLEETDDLRTRASKVQLLKRVLHRKVKKHLKKEENISKGYRRQTDSFVLVRVGSI